MRSVVPRITLTLIAVASTSPATGPLAPTVQVGASLIVTFAAGVPDGTPLAVMLTVETPATPDEGAVEVFCFTEAGTVAEHIPATELQLRRRSHQKRRRTGRRQ